MSDLSVQLPSAERQREITENFLRVKENIARAMERRRAGTGEVRLLAATKTVPPGEILFAANALGLDLIGENRVSELTEKYPALEGKIEQHFIGHLQTNKVGKVVGRVSVIESVDSLHLAAEIDRRSRALGIVSDILIEINSGREESKGGVMPEDVFAFCEKLEAFSALRVRGMMTMAPVQEKKEGFRKFFQETYGIFIDFFTKKSHNIIEPVFSLAPILSMGMSESYEIAIEEGATEVRVGSAIFGKRAYAKGNDIR